MALYEPNDTELAEVNTKALVKTNDLAGRNFEGKIINGDLSPKPLAKLLN